MQANNRKSNSISTYHYIKLILFALAIFSFITFRVVTIHATPHHQTHFAKSIQQAAKELHMTTDELNAILLNRAHSALDGNTPVKEADKSST